jgi:hypothetical protein
MYHVTGALVRFRFIEDHSRKIGCRTSHELTSTLDAEANSSQIKPAPMYSVLYSTSAPQFYKNLPKAGKEIKKLRHHAGGGAFPSTHPRLMTVSQIEPQSVTHRYLDEEDLLLGQTD